MTALPAASKWLSRSCRDRQAEQGRGRTSGRPPGASGICRPGSSGRRPPPCARDPGSCRGRSRRPAGDLRAAAAPALGVARSTCRVLRLRLLIPISRDVSRSARASSASSCTSTRTSMPNSLARRDSPEPHDRRGRPRSGDAVGAQRPGLDHLIGLEHEVLAQAGQDGRPRGLEIASAPWKAGSRSGPTGRPRRPRIGLGKRRRIEVRPDQPVAGRAFLISAISPNRLSASLASSAATKPRGGRSASRRSSCASGTAPSGGDRLAPPGADLGQDVSHGRGLVRDRDQPRQHRLGRAAVDRLGGERHALARSRRARRRPGRRRRSAARCRDRGRARRPAARAARRRWSRRRRRAGPRAAPAAGRRPRA